MDSIDAYLESVKSSSHAIMDRAAKKIRQYAEIIGEETDAIQRATKKAAAMKTLLTSYNTLASEGKPIPPFSIENVIGINDFFYRDMFCVIDGDGLHNYEVLINDSNSIVKKLSDSVITHDQEHGIFKLVLPENIALRNAFMNRIMKHIYESQGQATYHCNIIFSVDEYYGLIHIMIQRNSPLLVDTVSLDGEYDIEACAGRLLSCL